MKDDTFQRILDKLREATFCTSLCDCCDSSSLVFRMDRALSMTKNGTLAECSVLTSKGSMMNQFFGFELATRQCNHEQTKSFRANFDNEQWKVLENHGYHAIMIGGKFRSGVIDLSSDRCAILPFDRHAKSEADARVVNFAEMFAGGFSGWTFVAKSISKMGIDLRHLWAIDKDPDCRESYVFTHKPDITAITRDQFWKDFRQDQDDYGHRSVFVHAPISERWWLTAFPEELDILAASPPCPPWAITNHAPGFDRSDGLTFLEMMQYAAWIRPRVLVIENIASITKHPHWNVIKAVFQWAHYQIKGFLNLNLLDQGPQQRERMILIAVDVHDDSVTDHVFEKWPVAKFPSLKGYHALISELGLWKDYTDITYDEMLRYCDVNSMPRDTTVKGHSKRSLRDLQKYRFRNEMGYAACFMTSYGQPCQLKDSLLKDGGLYGSLLQQGTSIRKFAPPEIAFLQGLIDDLWLPKNYRQQMKILGNCISIPHAAWGLVNAILMIYEDIFGRPCFEVFQDIIGDRIHAMNYMCEERDGGFVISRRESHDFLDISPTLPLRGFSKVTVRTTLQEYTIVCSEHVSIVNAIRLLTGQSCPSTISMQPCDAHEFTLPLTHEVRAGSLDHHVIVNVASRLILPDSSFFMSIAGLDMVCILTPQMILVVERFFGMQIRDFHTFLSQHPQLQGFEWCILDSCGSILSDDLDAPSCVFACEMPLKSKLDLMSWNHIQFRECCLTFQAVANMKEIHDFLNFLDAKGILQGIQSLGWDFVISLDFRSCSDKRKLMLIQRPGFLPAMPDMIKRFLQARIFAGLLSEFCGMPATKEGYQIEKVSIKLWDLHLWKGYVNSAMKGQTILDLWEMASLIVNDHVELRLIVDGRQFNPEFELSSIVTITTVVIKIHLITALHGGGSSSQSDCSVESIETIPSSESIMDDSSVEQHVPVFHRDYPRQDVIALEAQSHDAIVANVITFVLDQQVSERSCDIEMFRGLVLKELDIGLFFQTTPSKIISILEFFSSSGIERAFRRVGWMAVMEFVQFGSDPVTRLLLIPIPPGNEGTMSHCSKSAVRSIFLTLTHALSLPIVRNVRATVFVGIKAWGVWIFMGWVDGYALVSTFTRPWELLAEVVERPSQLRVVCKGRAVNPERQIVEFTHCNERNELCVNFHLVMQLQGGGFGKQTKSETVVKNKNAIASFLLERGADLQQTSIFAEKIVVSAGGQAIYHIISIQDDATKMQALVKLAKTLNLTVPDINHVHAQKSKTVGKKIKDQKMVGPPLCASDFRIKPGFFLNQDGSNCDQIDAIQAGCSGICLMSPEEAIPWVQSDQTLSQDELAVLVLGQCPAVDKKACRRTTTPAFDVHDKPILLSTCLHCVGNKQVKISERSKAADIVVSSTVVCALTIFQDELEEGSWSKLLDAPVKMCFDLLQQSGVTLTLPCAPWGRSWRNAQGKCPPQTADSFQVHIRLPSDRKEALMKISGICKVYVTPKSDDHLIDEEFSIIWLDKNLGELKVLVAACHHHFGLVKVVKSNGKKINRGIRFHKDKFKEMHESLKPGITVPIQMTCVHFAKLAPTPVGASHEQVLAWLKEIDWLAKPVKPLGASAWMIGAPKKFEATWASWNNQLLLLSWFPPKSTQAQKVVVAGSVQPKTTANEVVNSVTTGGLQVDPWAAYVRQSGRVLDNEAPKGDGRSTSSIPRVTTGPIEDRFAKQDQQIDSLKSSLQAVTARLDTQEKRHEAFQHDVKSEFSAVKSDMTAQCKALTASFEDTLNRSLRRQDQQLGDAFTELKALIMEKAVPAKKAKTAKPTNEEDGNL